MSYLWGEGDEWPAFPQGVRLTFYHAGKVVKLDLHLAEGVAAVTTGQTVSIVKLAPTSPEVDALIAHYLPAIAIH